LHLLSSDIHNSIDFNTDRNMWQINLDSSKETNL
jgi:hypothetical protein